MSRLNSIVDPGDGQSDMLGMDIEPENHWKHHHKSKYFNTK